MTSILPPNSTPVERAFEAALKAMCDIAVPIADLWSPERCPETHLPWLAWALSVDDWDSTWPVETKREVIAASIEIHRRKGTRGGVSRALVAMGYGDAVLIEDHQWPRIGDVDLLIGGTYVEPNLGSWVLGPADPNWADYWVEIQKPIRRRDADRLAERLGSVAPVRCRLRSVSLTGVFYTLGDDLWLIGDDIALGNIYSYEV